jgi:Flp pilus assembly protein CpaB
MLLPRLPRRARIALATRPLVHWTLTLALAAGAAAVVGRLAASAEDARARWGTTRPVVVTTRAIAAGETVDGRDTASRALPAALVPPTAVTAVADGAVAAAPLDAGEIVTTARLGRAGRSPVAALVPPGWRAVAVPAPPPGLALAVGDVVDVFGADVTAHGARVVRVTGDAAVIAVPEADAGFVAAAVAAGGVELALGP